MAGFYDPLARLVFGNSLQKAQLVTLDAIPENASVLILGGGTGWILEQVLQHCKCRQILYLEASEKMLELTSRKLQQLPELKMKTELRPGTEKDLRPGETFDVIITHFLLDLFEEPRLLTLTAELEERLHPGGFWLVSDFRFAPEKQAFWQRTLLKLMYRFFRFTCRIEASTLPDWNGALERLSLIKIKSGFFYNQMIEAAVYRKQDTALTA